MNSQAKCNEKNQQTLFDFKTLEKPLKNILQISYIN